MGVGHFKAYNGHSYPRAGDGFLDCFGYATGEEGEVAVFVFGEIEDVVDFTTGMTRTWPRATGLMSRKA